jgi:pimeloyl-ACP methyl ester carboxylesterase
MQAHTPDTQTRYRTVTVNGLDIFYREAGAPTAPTVLLLHGFPTSSHMFRNLIPALADNYHLVAPDYPGFGYSAMPRVDEFEYSFDHLAEVIDAFTQKLELKRYSLYVQDYGAPIGFRLASKHPERVQALIVQNGNAYEEGIDNDFWTPIKAYWRDRNDTTTAAVATALELEAVRWQYTHGVRDASTISPDNWQHDVSLLNRPGNRDIQLELFYSYGTNPPRYAEWHAYFREHQPPTLIAWGRNDAIFPAVGAHPYQRDLKHVDFHLLETGHFALEEDGPIIAALMRDFLARAVPQTGKTHAAASVSATR